MKLKFEFPVGKIAEKAVCRECIFDNMALYFGCPILQTVFCRFCPLGSIDGRLDRRIKYGQNANLLFAKEPRVSD